MKIFFPQMEIYIFVSIILYFVVFHGNSEIVVFGNIFNSENSDEGRPKVQKQNDNLFYEQNNSNVLLVQ